ncbi:MAG TPA: hypothetical protein VMT73_08715 [Anaerolineales bacterium]|nr:hypothetical protein [Anaerolineales bacterium]
MVSTSLISSDYWKTLQVTPHDTEFLHNYLFEREVPLTARELVPVLVSERMAAERDALKQQHESSGKLYFPKETYQAGDNLVFPALSWQKGKVTDVRKGANPSAGEFEVITVSMEDGPERLFAANLAAHTLNDVSTSAPEDEHIDVDSILHENGSELEMKIEDAFQADDDLVQIAGRWFPRALLVDVNVGHLNLAEAVLDMSGGEPQPAAVLLKDVELPAGVNPKLAEFSLNLALQEDERFDEVGPAGRVLWCLRRLEPQGVREVPSFLQYVPIDHDRSKLTPQMLNLEAQLDDELSPVHETDAGSHKVDALTLSLIYPHLRAGTLPLSARARTLFPTAYESPRVRFTLVDGKTGAKMPAWVVRTNGYVYGLREWYKSHVLIPGSLVEIKRSDTPGEVIVEARTQRSTKDWVRTLMVGADGGMVFAMLKQPITAEFNDRMAIFVPDFGLLDPLWGKKRSFEEIVISIMRELTKLTPQGHVHAQELYAAVNLVRRVPPAPLLAMLADKPFVHVGDLHFRLGEEDV